MSGAHEALERAEHVAHGGQGHGAPDRLGLYIGVTMAILGVILAFCSALVGSERTNLLQKLVEEEHAHAKYQAQDVKHRVAFLALAQTHALAFGSDPDKVNKTDAMIMANTVDRYLEESGLAKEWVNAFPPVVHIHMEAQESYEHALLFAEVGIVIASIALMMKKRPVWIASAIMGVAALGIAGQTYVHNKHEMHDSLTKIAVAQKKYEDTRASHKTTEQEKLTVKEVKKWASEGPNAAQALIKPGSKGEPKTEAKGEIAPEKAEEKKNEPAKH